MNGLSKMTLESSQITVSLATLRKKQLVAMSVASLTEEC